MSAEKKLPFSGRCPSIPYSEGVLVVRLAQEDAVGDDVPVRGYRDELLGLPDRERFIVVRAHRHEQPGGVGAEMTVSNM